MTAVKVLCFTLSVFLLISASSVSGKVAPVKVTPKPVAGTGVPGHIIRASRAASAECSNLIVNSTQLELARNADIVVTGTQGCGTGVKAALG